MTAYDPSPAVSINGVDYTSETVNSITVTGGRSSTEEQPRASYANIQLVNTAGTAVNVNLNDHINCTQHNTSGTAINLFTGQVTDISRQIVDYGSAGYATITTITAIGPLARLTRTPSDLSYPMQFDGDMIADILAGWILSDWNGLDLGDTWDDLDPTTDWDNWTTGIVGHITTPGDYQIHMYTGNSVDQLSLCQNVAKSAMGVLYETAAGIINYDSISTRATRFAAGYVDLPAAYLAPALGVESRIGDVINDITLIYKNGSSTSATNTPSIDQYGTYAASVSTMLEDSTQAIAQRDYYLTTRSIARQALTGITVPMHNPNLPDATRDALLGAYCGLQIYISGLPAPIRSLPFNGFVEGYTWNVTRKTSTLSMIVSDYALSAIQEAWRQVSTGLFWNTMDTGILWENAQEVY